MRSGIWRGIAVAIAAVCAFLMGPAAEVRAGGLFHHTIPRETLALDYRTGDVMVAPPIPYGSYAKDHLGAVHDAAGLTFGAIHGLVGKVHGLKGALCSKCGGGACGQCGGGGLFHGRSCGACGGDGCGNCDSGQGGHGGLFHRGDSGCNGDGCTGTGHGHDGLFSNGGHGHGLHAGNGVAFVGAGEMIASSPGVPAKAVGQSYPQPTAQMEIPAVCGGCLGTGHLSNGGGCGICGGSGRLRNLFGHRGGSEAGMCGGCGGRGCGACGGRGLLNHGGDACGNCNGAGCGMCGGQGKVCGNCKGAGCGLCAHLKGKAHSLMGLPLGLVGKICHKGQIKYFVGPGGPVPLTPGYVPYVVSTRSPRDFFAFPPFSDQTP